MTLSKKNCSFCRKEYVHDAKNGPDLICSEKCIEERKLNRIRREFNREAMTPTEQLAQSFIVAMLPNVLKHYSYDSLVNQAFDLADIFILTALDKQQATKRS